MKRRSLYGGVERSVRRLCWLLETSVRTVDDFTYDFFIFLVTAVLTDEELKQEHFSCLPP
jgi:hypothetical protein